MTNTDYTIDIVLGDIIKEDFECGGSASLLLVMLISINKTKALYDTVKGFCFGDLYQDLGDNRSYTPCIYSASSIAAWKSSHSSKLNVKDISLCGVHNTSLSSPSGNGKVYSSTFNSRVKCLKDFNCSSENVNRKLCCQIFSVLHSTHWLITTAPLRLKI